MKFILFILCLINVLVIAENYLTQNYNWMIFGLVVLYINSKALDNLINQGEKDEE